MVAIAINGVLALLVLIISVVFCKNYNFKSKSNLKIIRDSKTIKILAVVTLTSYTIGIVLFFLGNVIDIASNCSDDGIAIFGVGFTLNFISFSLILVLFSIRLVKTFEDTIYALSNRYVMFIKYAPFVAIGYVILMTLLSIVEVLRGSITVILASLFLLFIVFSCIGLLLLFIRKINIVINDFIKQFGKVSGPQLSSLNKSLRYAHTLIYNATFKTTFYTLN